MTTSCRLSTPSVIGGEVNNNYFDKPSPMPPPPHRREILYNHIQNHPFASEKWRQLLDRFPLNFSLSHSNINLSHKHITQLKKPPEIGRLFIGISKIRLSSCCHRDSRGRERGYRYPYGRYGLPSLRYQGRELPS